MFDGRVSSVIMCSRLDSVAAMLAVCHLVCHCLALSDGSVCKEMLVSPSLGTVQLLQQRYHHVIPARTLAGGAS